MSEVKVPRWELMPLGEIFNLQTRTLLPPAYPEREFVHHSLPSFDESGGPRNQLGREIESNKTVIGRPSILVSKLNPRIPRVSLIQEVSPNEHHCASTEFMVYEPISKDIDLRFFHTVFLSDMFRRCLTSTATGTTGSRTRAHPKETLRWLIPVPPLPEQRRIAEILETADEAIQSTERLIAKLGQARQGLLHDLLTPGTGWAAGRFGDYLLDIDAGRSPDLPDRPAGADEWGVLKVSAIRPDGLQEDENKVVTRPSLIDSKIEVGNGDLLISRANTTALVGLVCYVRDPRPGLMLCDKTLRLNINQRSAIPEFAAYLLQTPSARRQIEMSGTGSSGSMKNISQKEIRSFILPWPRVDEQQRILARIEGTRLRLQAEREEFTKLRLLKRGLMDDLLTGQVQVGASR